MQVKAWKLPLATDNNRDCKFASVLQKYMIYQAGAGAHFNKLWEWYTLSMMLLFPCFGSCNDHRDKNNCLLYAYSKTGCANFIIKDKTGNIYLKFMSISELLLNHSSCHIIIMSHVSSTTSSCIYTS